MLIKLLLVIGVIAAVYFFFIKKSTPLTKERHAKKSNETEDETMVECVVCSTFITTKEAIISNKQYYCSTECLDKA